MHLDYGPCPAQPCGQGAKCACLSLGQYYCQCPSGWMGQYCQFQPGPPSQSNNLWALIAIPLAVALLLVILAAACVATRSRARRVIVTDSVEDLYPVEEPEPQPPAPLDVGPPPELEPTETLYHALGKTFAIAFNDRTFNKPPGSVYSGTGSSYSTIRKGGYDGLAYGGSIGPGSTYAGPPSVISASPTENFYSTIGKKFAIVINDKSFSRDGSELGGRGSAISSRY